MAEGSPASWKAERLEAGLRRGQPIRLRVDGVEATAFEGETIAVAVFTAGTRVMRRMPRSGSFRGLFCGMGVCYDCLVTVDGRPNVRACVTPAGEGMSITTRPT